MISKEGSVYSKLTFDVTNLAQLWHNADDVKNAGIAFGYATSTYDYNAVVSSEGTASNAPMMEVSYRTARKASVIEDGKVYYIRTMGGKCLDISKNSTANGAEAQTYPLGYGNSLCWKISIEDGYYTIRSMLPSGRTMLLDARGNCVPGAQVATFEKDTNSDMYGNTFIHSSQLWEIERVDGIFYTISPKRNPDVYLDYSLNNGTSGSGNRSVKMQKKGPILSNQMWSFEEVCVEGKDYVLSKPTDDDPGYYTNSFSVRIAYDLRRSDVVNAINDWNSKADVDITQTTSMTNHILVADFPNEDHKNILGKYISTRNSGGRSREFKIHIYVDNMTATINNNNLSEENIERFYRQTIKHELGHALGLDDQPTGKASIMKYFSDPWLHDEIQTADIVGVSHYYS